jgi:hypothetical protein
MRRSATLLALVLVAVGPAVAQPASLAVTPDTLEWAGPDRPFVIQNVGASEVHLDSITVGRCEGVLCGERGPAYYLELSHGDSLHGGYALGGGGAWWDGFGPFPELVLTPGDSALLGVRGIDGCSACVQGGTGDTRAPFLFWAGGFTTPVERTFAYSYPVASEPGAASERVALDLDGPNPFAGETALVLRLGRPSEVDVALHDGLGRRVRMLRAGVLAAGAHRLPVSADGLGPGVYFARAVVGAGRGATVAVRRLVVLR